MDVVDCPEQTRLALSNLVQLDDQLLLCACVLTYATVRSDLVTPESQSSYHYLPAFHTVPNENCIYIYRCYIYTVRNENCIYIYDQVLFGRNKVVSITAFFLMKNVLRHGREKNI